jgi:hypothetical protein
VFDITSKLISAMDIVSMGISSVDQLAPYVRDIQTAFNNYPNLPHNFDGIQVVRKWIDFFANKSATDELNEGELRQLKFDIETIMNQFNQFLRSN